MKISFAGRSALLSLALLTLPLQPSFAQAGPQTNNACQSWFRLIQTRDGDPLNLRRNPNGPVIGVVANGSEVLFNTGDRSGDWSEITLKGGKTGWVADRYLSRHAADAANYSGQWRIKTLDGDSVALRADAGTGYRAIGVLQPGEIVTELDNVGYWTQVRTRSGKVGYVSNQFLVCR